MHKPISRLGFGGWQLGNHQEWGQMDEEQGIKLVQTAFENGITFFDTAPNYAAGRSEIYLGMATKLFRDKIYLNSKYGHDPDGNIGFSVAGIEPSIRGSLKRLQTTYLDSLLLHNPPMEILNGATSHFQELERLKQVGLIRAYGVSIDTAEEVEAVLKQPNVTIIELLYNIFFQSCRKLLSDIHKRGILLIIKVPLDSGWLTGKYTAKATFEGIRHRWSQEDIQRRADLVNQLSNITKDTSLTKYAMGFLFSYPEITTIIPGIKTIEQLHDHLNHQKYVLPHDIKQQFENLYDQSIAKNPLPW
jgi:aryl-alcohol dehydrogenase-like predicted oxidoreductase